MSAQTPKAKSTRKPAESWPPDWPVKGSTPILILVGLILVCDDDGAYVATQAELAAFGDRCVETARSAIENLERCNCLNVERARRRKGGTFAAKLYRLNLTNERVRTMFELLRGAPGAGAMEANSPDSPYPSLPHSEAKRRQKNAAHHPETRDGAYIGTRARAGASSNFVFFHSLPADFEIEEDLRPLVEKVLSVCGVGLGNVRTPGLLESLVECLSEALDDEYDFELDILPCVKRKTAGHRIEPLWSFRIIFKNDLPEWKRNRLAKEKRREPDARTPRRGRYEGDAYPKSDSLDALLDKASSNKDAPTRAKTLRLTLAQLEDPNAPDWLLPQACRNLTGEERASAIARERERIVAQLSQLESGPSPKL